jgi:hypothetical protein
LCCFQRSKRILKKSFWCIYTSMPTGKETYLRYWYKFIKYSGIGILSPIFLDWWYKINLLPMIKTGLKNELWCITTSEKFIRTDLGSEIYKRKWKKQVYGTGLNVKWPIRIRTKMSQITNNDFYYRYLDGTGSFGRVMLIVLLKFLMNHHK